MLKKLPLKFLVFVFISLVFPILTLIEITSSNTEVFGTSGNEYLIEAIFGAITLIYGPFLLIFERKLDRILKVQIVILTVINIPVVMLFMAILFFATVSF
jgi:hypothetical protein